MQKFYLKLSRSRYLQNVFGVWLFRIIKEGKTVPLVRDKVLVDSSIFMDRLDRMRAVLPEELENARMLMAHKENIISKAATDAELYVEQSRVEASKLVEENEITQQAIAVAEKILDDSRRQADEIQADADDYAEAVLAHIEQVLQRALEAVLQGKASFSDENITNEEDNLL